MKKSLVAVAACAAAAGACAQSSSVQLFGVVDAAVTYTTGSGYGSSSKWQLTNSGNSFSRLGFRGSEDLGGGLAASFWLEAGLQNDNGTGFNSNTNNQSSGAGVPGVLSFNRRSTVSFSGGFGELRLGRDYTPTFWNDTIFSPFTTVGVGANVVSTVGANVQTVRGPGSTLAASDNYLRTSNSIGYFLPPTLGGVYGQLQYALHENIRQSNLPDSPSTKGRSIGGRIGYAAGPLDVALAFAESTAADGALVNAAGVPTGTYLNEKIKTISLGASYNFEVLKLFGELSQVKDQSRSTSAVPVFSLLTASDNDKYTGGLFGITVPVGAGLIKASYSRVKFDNDLGSLTTPFMPSRDASVTKLAIGYEYNLSKRTTLYATAARIRVKDGQNNPAIMGATLGGSATYLSTGAGTSGYAPSKATGYDFGIRHAF